MHQNKTSICSGAGEGNRTLLSRIDNPLPSQRTTTAYMVLREGIEPSSDAYKAPASPAMLTEQIGIAYGDRTRLIRLKA